MSPPSLTIEYAKRGHVATITLNRPTVLNALDARLHEQLSVAIDDFEADDEMWLGVVTGAGRAFSVGQDLKELASEPDAPRGTFGSRGRPGWPRLTERFHMAKPLIAKVRGYALGGGFELALACDIIVASEDAIFGLPEASLGLIPGAGGVFRLTRQLPLKTAMGLLLTGATLTARRAFELGLVNAVAADDDLDAAVDQWAHDILRCAPLSLRAIKEAATQSAHLSMRQAFETMYPWEQRRERSQDAIEGPRAFIEKRAPRWSNS